MWRETMRVCADCGRVYSPNLLSGGRLPRGYTRCPVCGSKKTTWLVR